MNGNTKGIAIGIVSAVLVIIAVVVAWQTIRGMQPNAVYEGATHGAERSTASGHAVQTPMSRFQKMQGKTER